MSNPGELRIGHQERNRLIEILQRAAAEGRLTDAEVAERSGRVEVARTYADLDALVTDLPVSPPSQAFLAPAAVPAPAPMAQQVNPAAPIGWQPNDRLILSGGGSSEKRRGYWEIPPFLRVSGDMGSVLLDCMEAVCLRQVVDVEVSGGMGSIKIIVPDGWGIDTDRISKGWGSVKNTAERAAAPGQPLWVLHGSAGWGSITIRYATDRERKRLAKQAALTGRQTPQLPPGQAWSQSSGPMPNADDLR